MKEILMSLVSALALCAADIPSVIADNLWTYEQKFNTLTDGALNGQDGWSGDNDFAVETSVKYEGAKGLGVSSGANGYIHRAITAVPSGVVYFAMRRVSGTDCTVDFRVGTNIRIRLAYESNGVAEITNGANADIFIASINTGVFYLFEITFNASNQHYLRYHDGSSWSSSIGPLAAAYNGDIDDIQIGSGGGAGVAYWDYISPNYEPPTPTPTITPTPTNTPTVTPTPTQTPTATNTPDIVPPGAPVIENFVYDKLGRITQIWGTAETCATVYVYDGGAGIGSTTAGGGGDWTLSGLSLEAGPHSIHAVAKDSPNNESQPSYSYSMLGLSGVNVHQDATVTHSASASLRIEQEGSCDFRLAVNDGVTPNPDEPVTVKAWMRKNSDYSGAEPKVTLTGLGIAGTGSATAAMTVGADAWEELTVTGTPDARGVLTLKAETFSIADGAKAWIDDITASQ